MSFKINDQFETQVALSVDKWAISADSTARDAIPSGVRYVGMETYDQTAKKKYRLNNGILNTDWEEIKGGLDTTQFLTYLYGNATTDGSIRFNTTNGDFTVEKRVSGTWTFIGSFSV